MRTAYLAFFLCSLVLVNEVYTQSALACPKCKWWVKVWRWGFWPVASARFAVWKILRLQPFQYKLFIKWAVAANYNKIYKRFTQYRVWFKIKLRKWPYTKYNCRAWVVWPKKSSPFLVGYPMFSNCIPYK